MIDHSKLLEGIRLRNIPINWKAIRRLRTEIADLRGTSTKVNTPRFALPSKLNFAIPMVASVVVHAQNGTTAEKFPDMQDVERLLPSVKAVNWLLGKVSKKLQSRFSAFVLKRAEAKIRDAGMKVVHALETLEPFTQPRRQLFNELFFLYGLLCKRCADETYWGSDHDVMSIEKKFSICTKALRRGEDGIDGFNQSVFPLLYLLAEKCHLLDKEHIRFAVSILAPEIMSGIEMFLRKDFSNHLRKAPTAEEFSFFSLRSWGRLIANTFFAKKIAMLKECLPEMLTHAVEVMPEDGEQVLDHLREMAEAICQLDRDGVSSDVITQEIFA